MANTNQPKKRTKPEKPTLEKILVFSKRNVSQLCDMIPDSVIGNRIIKEWTESLDKAKRKLSLRQQSINRKNLQMESEESEWRVTVLRNGVEIEKLEQETIGLEKIELQRRKAIIDILKKRLIPEPKDVTSGDMQLVQSHIIKKFTELESEWFPETGLKANK